MTGCTVLVVDDCAPFRRVLQRELQWKNGIDHVILAASGPEALALIEREAPDVVVLDVIMPEMDGLAVLKAIRARHAKLPVIMFSALTQKAAMVTLEAIGLGASDYVFKPSTSQEAARSITQILLPKILALAGSATARWTVPAQALRSSRERAARCEVVVIGVSTGGPRALEILFRGLPRELPVPVLIVQHVPADFTSYLAQRLSGVSALPVHLAVEGGALEPGQAWLAPGERHLALEQQERGAVVMRLVDSPAENSCKPAVDVLFRSASAVYGPRVLGVVLTGMGQDGARGAQAISAAGGQVIVQDRETSVVWGMPGAVAAAGLADAVLPIEQIAGTIASLACPPSPFQRRAAR